MPENDRYGHFPRVDWRGRAGETLGYAPRCSCGWGYGEPLEGSEAAAMARANEHGAEAGERERHEHA